MFASTLLSWFRLNGRQLPWRETSDPYAIWLSEIILQQTRVNQGMAYWQRFMEHYPTVGQLAAASEDDVLLLWQGLGYYSRARNLHKAARQIVELGHFPNTFLEIKKLKGVGDYTAAAIASIAFGEPVAVVDGNVYRVLARHYGISTPINTTEGKREFAALAQSLLPIAEPSLYNQAIMDFGALQCVPKSPRCEACPLMLTCVAQREGRVGELPAKERKLTVKTRRLSYIYIRCKGMTAIRRRPAGDIWQGLWEPFLLPEGDDTPPEEAILRLTGGQGRLTAIAHGVRHVLTHRVILADFHLLETIERPTLPADYVWISEETLADYALSRLVQLLLERLRKK